VKTLAKHKEGIIGTAICDGTTQNGGIEFALMIINKGGKVHARGRRLLDASLTLSTSGIVGIKALTSPRSAKYDAKRKAPGGGAATAAP
jgi:hypothetical protein